MSHNCQRTLSPNLPRWDPLSSLPKVLSPLIGRPPLEIGRGGSAVPGPKEGKLSPFTRHLTALPPRKKCCLNFALWTAQYPTKCCLRIRVRIRSRNRRLSPDPKKITLLRSNEIFLVSTCTGDNHGLPSCPVARPTNDYTNRPPSSQARADGSALFALLRTCTLVRRMHMGSALFSLTLLSLSSHNKGSLFLHPPSPGKVQYIASRFDT